MTVDSPQPFDPQAPRTVGRGCGRAALLGCGVFLLLIGIAAVVVVLKAKDVMRWGLDKMQAQIEAEIDRATPADLTSEDRARLKTAFDAAISKVTSGEADPTALSKLQGELQRVTGRAGRAWTRDEVMSLVVALEEIAGEKGETQPTPEVPATEPEPVPGVDGTLEPLADSSSVATAATAAAPAEPAPP